MINEKYTSVFEDDNETRPLLPHAERLHPRKPLTAGERLVRYVVPCILLLSAISLLVIQGLLCHYIGLPDSWNFIDPIDEVTMPGYATKSTKVQLEAHIMSKCPDARDCLQQLVVPTMEQVSDLVDFKLSYIGR